MECDQKNSQIQGLAHLISVAYSSASHHLVQRWQMLSLFMSWLPRVLLIMFPGSVRQKVWWLITNVCYGGCIKEDSFHPSLSTTLLCSSYLLLAAQETIPPKQSFKQWLKATVLYFPNKSAIGVESRGDSSYLTYSGSWAAHRRLQDLLLRWLIHTVGKWVLPIGWLLSWGYQPEASVPPQVSLIKGLLGLPHSMVAGSQEMASRHC